MVWVAVRYEFSTNGKKRVQMAKAGPKTRFRIAVIATTLQLVIIAHAIAWSFCNSGSDVSPFIRISIFTLLGPRDLFIKSEPQRNSPSLPFLYICAWTNSNLKLWSSFTWPQGLVRSTRRLTISKFVPRSPASLVERSGFTSPGFFGENFRTKTECGRQRNEVLRFVDGIKSLRFVDVILIASVKRK